MKYIGIDLGGTNTKGALVSESGEILREASCQTQTECGTDAVCDNIAAIICTLAESVEKAELGGIGLGCPGTVDDDAGIVRLAANLGFANYDLRSQIECRCGYSVRLGNDANVAALAEALVGVGRGCENFAVITLGTGVGGGIVLNGKLLTGYTGAASELGHMVIREGGEPCTCGRSGCFEAYSSATALIRETKNMMATHPKSLMHIIAAKSGAVDGRTAFDAALVGDVAAQEVRDNYIENLACGVANIVNIFFPEVIAFSGGIANQGDALLVPLRNRVNQLTFGSAYAAKHTRIECCTLGYRSGMIGAALLSKQFVSI